MTSLILASESETRKKMLENAGVSFTAVKPLVDEKLLRDSLVAEKAPARDIADALAETKARSVSMMHPESYVLGADQILERDGRIFEKAADRAGATHVLRALSGGTHQLFSAAVIYQAGQPVWRFVDTARMTVRPLDDDFIDAYLDKVGDAAFWSVGAYQFEGLGANLFTRVEGSHFTVLGLPLLPLLDYFRRIGLVAL